MEKTAPKYIAECQSRLYKPHPTIPNALISPTGKVIFLNPDKKENSQILFKQSTQNKTLGG